MSAVESRTALWPAVATVMATVVLAGGAALLGDGSEPSRLSRFCSAASEESAALRSSAPGQRAAALAGIAGVAPPEVRQHLAVAADGARAGGELSDAAGPVDVEEASAAMAARAQGLQAWDEVAEVLLADCGLQVVG